MGATSPPCELFSITLFDFVSLGVALLAVIIATWNAHVTRLHNRLSVRPVLVCEKRFRGNGDYYGTIIINRGVGPAILTSMTLFLDGNKIEDNHDAWGSAFVSAGLDMESHWVLARMPNTTIAPGDRIHLLTAPAAPEDPNDIIRALSRLKVTVQYKSLYNDCQPDLCFRFANLDQVIESAR